MMRSGQRVLLVYEDLSVRNSFVWSVCLSPFHLFLHPCGGNFLSDDNPDTALIVWAAHSVWTRNSWLSRLDVKALFVGDMIDL